MAEGDDSAPIIAELVGADGVPVKTEADPATSDGGTSPLHRLHETRLVRSAGRMLAGMTMPVPAGLGGRSVAVVVQKAAPLPASSDKREAGFPRTAIAVACAVALSSTAPFTSLLNSGEPGPASGSQPRQGDEQPAAEITAALPQAEPVQLLAISPMPLAGLSPPAAHGSKAPSSSIMRVAQKDSPTLEVSNIFGPAGKPIRILVSLNGGKAEDYSFLMFRGLPPKLTLSAGFRLKESWAVSLRDLENLTMEAPADFQGTFNVEVLLIKGREAPAESRVISVEIVTQDIQLPVTSALGEPVPGPRVLTAAPRTPDAERSLTPKRPQEAARARPIVPAAEEDAMMKRAETLLRNNDVASARLLYEHLAGNGSARAALAMGKTFDPAFFRSTGATGLKPDVEKARAWYRQAAGLGDQEAPSRLNALASR